MALSSTSSIPKSFEYDVFLSFRGEDTRKTFVDHLYLALRGKNITTFKDDKSLEKGERISTELIKAIENSRFHIIVFSENYASSSWCLDELVKIMECQKTTEQKAYPIFYNVEPTEVRKQSGVFGKGFDNRRMDEDAGKWIEALEEAASLSGWELKSTTDGHEGQFIRTVVEEISHKIPFIASSFDENLVGMGTRTDAIISSLETCVDDVRMIGIWGIGGGGKTTLARAVFDLMSSQFKHKSFLEDVREVSRSNVSSLKKLQKQMLRYVLKQKDVDLTKFKISMHHLKVLVVLDDVDDIEQLEALARKNWFGPGSAIIITTRDEQVLISHGVKMIHDVNKLSDEEALCLFNRFAFGGEILDPRYNELLQQFVRYAYGHPLTIKVLGSDLIGKDEDYWKETLEKLKKNPPEKVLNRLELSYMGLTKENKCIFLDVACFWKGERKDIAIRALESCQLYPIVGLRDLERKSLINVVKVKGEFYDGTKDVVWEIIRMHDRIQDMGQEIVRREHPDEPYRRSRLWDDEEIEKILAEDLGGGATIGIKLTMTLNNEIYIKGLLKMKNLKFLLLVHRSYRGYSHEDEVSQYFPSSLQYLFWKNCPFRCLAITFRAKYIVGLEMWSCKGELWENGESKVLNKLKFLGLDCLRLTTLNLGVTPNLEMYGLGKTPNLEILDLDHTPNECPTLKSLVPSVSNIKSFDIVEAPNLQTLRLKEEDSSLRLWNKRYRCSNIRSIDLRRTLNFKELDIRSNVHLVELLTPNVFTELKALKLCCLNLKNLNLLMTPHLEILTLDSCDNLVEISFGGAPKLKCLELLGSNKLETLDLRECVNLATFSLIGHFFLLKYIHLNNSKLRTLKLELSGHPNFHTYNDFMLGCVSYILPQLRALDIAMAPNLEDLTLSGCRFQLKMPFEFPKLKTLNLDCSMLKTLRLRTPNLERLALECCSDFLLLHMIDECRKLKYIIIGGELRKLSIIGNISKVPEHLNWLHYLEELMLSFTKIEHIPLDMCILQHLKVLELEFCPLLEKLPEDLGRLECLEKLTLWNCRSLRVIPNDICNLKHLEYLSLRYCIAVEKLPEMLGSLEHLKELDIEDTSISHLPQGIVLFKDLHIIGSKLLLQSCEFTSQIKTLDYETFYYRGTRSSSLLYRAPHTSHN